MKKKVFTPKDPRKRAKGAIVGIVIHMTAVAVLGVLTLIHLSKLLGLEGGDTLPDGLAPGFHPYFLAYGLAAIAYVATLVVYGVLFLMWVHRTNRNAQTLSSGMDITPGWAVGWFFVPFASLFKPFQGLDQTWRVSTNPTRWRALDTPKMLRWWWGFYLTTNITGSLSNMVGKTLSAGGQTASAMISLVCFGTSLAAGLLAIRMVRQVTDLQTAALEAAAFA